MSTQPGESEVKLMVELKQHDASGWFTLWLTASADGRMMAKTGALALEVDGQVPAGFEEFKRDPYDFWLGGTGAKLELIRDETTGVYSNEPYSMRVPPGTRLEFAPGKHVIRPTYTLSDKEVELVERHMGWSLDRHVAGPTYELTISAEVPAP